MSLRLSTILVLASFSAAAPATFGKWIRLATADFELYTDEPQTIAEETIRQCERLRGFYEQLPEYRQQKWSLVRLVRFASAEQFAPYKSTGWEAGHYESNGNRDWIAIGPESSPARLAAVLAHEYHHLVAARAGMRLPPWLKEGLAEFFSVLRPASNGIEAGVPLPARLETLHRREWLPIDALLTRGEETFHAMQSGDADIFYAESWLLTHLLAGAPPYAAAFPKFLALIDRGMSARDTFQSVFGRSPEAVEIDLREHFNQGASSSRVFPNPPEPGPRPSSQPPPPPVSKSR